MLSSGPKETAGGIGVPWNLGRGKRGGMSRVGTRRVAALEKVGKQNSRIGNGIILADKKANYSGKGGKIGTILRGPKGLQKQGTSGKKTPQQMDTKKGGKHKAKYGEGSVTSG